MTLREYAKLMNDTALQGSLSNEEYNRLYRPLLDGIQSMIPPMLFRYRSCNELSLQALWDDKIWLSKGNVMNDDYVPILNFIALMIPFCTKMQMVHLLQLLPELSNYMPRLATVYKGNIIKNLIMDCQSYTKYRPNETTGGIFVSWRRKEELSTGA